MSIKSPNSRRLFVTVVVVGLLAMAAGNSAQAGYQVGIAVVVQAPVSQGGQCSYNFANINGNGGCSIALGSTGLVTPPNSPPDNSGTATAASAVVSGGTIAPGSGSVSVDLSKASVHLDASSVPAPPSPPGQNYSGSVVSEYGNYSDTLHYTVAGANPTTVTPIPFTFTIDGSMSGAGPFDSAQLPSGQLVGQVNYGNGGPPIGGDARFNLLWNSSTGYQTAIGYLDTYPSNAPGIWTHDAALTQFTYTDTFDLTGASGNFPISLSTQLVCEYGVTCNYGNTLQVALNPPSDVTLTSDSGVFPTQTPSPTPTPEPGSLGLLAFSIAGIALYRRRRLR